MTTGLRCTNAQKPYTLAGFKLGIFCSVSGCDDHYATPPGRLDIILRFLYFYQFIYLFGEASYIFMEYVLLCSLSKSNVKKQPHYTQAIFDLSTTTTTRPCRQGD
jgi:hypothetical protein